MMDVNCVLEMYSPYVDVSHYVLNNYCIIMSAICDLNYYIILIIIVSFMHDIHTHIPQTNHVPRGYIVTAIL